ncbi:MAG TPA: tetratricopeptide repeat protein [Tepidisphaeraceae bacterium]|jgi:lipoprotein NlpI|nr:tetratricopeptide repeat protein [Tepidisphaeraceae bacterium]
MSTKRYFVKSYILAIGFVAVSAALAGSASDELIASARARLDRRDNDGALDDANKAVTADPNNAACYAARAAVREARHEFAEAAADDSLVIKLLPQSPRAYQARGEDQFRLGKFKESIADFDKVIELKPDDAPYHWQRGISLYYAGEFDRGARQFELHKTVNPNDVENAVWHFLCVSRLRGVSEARKVLIPIEGDARVPMMQVYDLFSGKGTARAVMEAAEAGAQDEPNRRRQLFYAHLYLGLYDLSTGDADSAKKNILLAEKEADDDYMGDVARVHAALLRKAPPVK